MTARNEFAGQLVRLRAIEPGDAGVFHADLYDSDSGRRSGDFNPPASLAGSVDWATEASKRADPAKLTLAIEALDGPQVVGSISGSPEGDRRHGVFTYGLGIFDGHRGKGYGREAIRLLFRYYFDELGFVKAHSVVYGFNTESLAFHDALGFVREGVRRQAHFTMGRRHDVVLVGMTRDEYAARLA